MMLKNKLGASAQPGEGGLKHALPVVWSHDVADYAVALGASNDGTLVAVGTGGGEVSVFDAESGALKFQRVAHQGGVLALSWSPRARVLATAGQDGMARLFDASGAQLAELPGGAAWVEHLAWSPDGSHLATASGRAARVWTAQGEALLQTEPHESTLTGLAWNRKGTQLATGCYGGVTLFPLGADRPSRHLAWRGSLVSLSWSPNDAVIACGTQESSVHFWRLATGKDSEMSGFAAKPRSLAWDVDAKLLATGGDAAVSVWVFEGKGPEGKQPIMLAGHQALCTVVAFHPKRVVLATGADDTGVLLWEPRSSKKPIGFGFLEETITALAWAQGGRLLLATDAAGTVRAFQVS